MKIVIRLDSSITIGSGHLMRCLTLVDQLRDHGSTVYFVCRDLPGNFCSLVRNKGYDVRELVVDSETVDWQRDARQTEMLLEEIQPIDWLIVDHYGLDIRWEQFMRQTVKKIMVIDDLANRVHDCDILLDQNLYSNMEDRYSKLVPKECICLLGPQYALLRSEFLKIGKDIRKHDGDIRRILIFFGGSDPSNETGKALEALFLLKKACIEADVIVGFANPHKDKIKTVCQKENNIRYHCQVDNMARLMLNADLAIGAGGTTAWERCYLGLPTITVIIAENQIELTENLAKNGAIFNLGWYENVSQIDIAKAIQYLIDNKNEVKTMSRISTNIMCRTQNEMENNIVGLLTGEGSHV
jgi:UDP-2,4-diacetamido-2,4,6-trideoxy-beta-L-altropyranose hydrolase